MSSSVTCVACRHDIDAAAKLCPYCGADPRSGEKLDTQALLEEVFKPRELTTSESVLEYARHRQGVVVGGGIAVVLAILLGVHAFVTHRNETDVSAASAVPLAEVTDVGTANESQAPPPMPQLDFQYDGRPQTMRTFIVEPGAVAPPAPPAAPATATATTPPTTTTHQ